MRLSVAYRRPQEGRGFCKFELLIKNKLRKKVREKPQRGKEFDATSQRYINFTERQDPFNLAYVSSTYSEALSDVKHAGCTSSFFREESAGPPPS